jgi:fumarate reductase subunit C
MSSKPAGGAVSYTEFHPRWYRTRVSTFWWLGRWPYLKFILRELSSIFVAYFVALTLFQISALVRGPQAYARWEQALRSPLLILLNFIAFAFVMFHAITWFNLAPKAMPLRVGGKKLPDTLIAAPNYVLWLLVSGIIAWFVLRS